ncbi:Uncharacterized protein APZ42_004028 [Daphnia magna]|uniref:Uncharacterized protein n=1 Tax=Daphnia magna TaxID=35525 RepID=A0A164HAM0_9CRUS|nr:Uncharacterized protein APZ42_004028 [Daphnia magna]
MLRTNLSIQAAMRIRRCRLSARATTSSTGPLGLVIRKQPIDSSSWSINSVAGIWAGHYSGG